MDLSTLDVAAAAEEGAELHLRHPTTNELLFDGDDKVPVTITLAGADSERFRSAQRAQINRRLRKRGREDATIEAAEADAIELLAASTLGWSGIALDGEDLACTPANAKKLYRRMSWVREQVDVFMADRGNFLKP